MVENITLREVCDLRTMLAYCSSKLHWPIDVDAFDDVDEILYEYSAHELGIKEKFFIKIGTLKQLLPFTESQTWGIFSVEFAEGQLDISVLKKIVAGLVHRRRNNSGKVWKCDKLLFLCFWGSAETRSIAFVTAQQDASPLLIIKAQYCTPGQEDCAQLENFEHKLLPLSWPKQPCDDKLAEWSKFVARERREIIRTSVELTEALAKKADHIARTLHKNNAIEGDHCTTNTLYTRFRKSIHSEISLEQFFDMYAQTIVYGLFSARCMAPDIEDFTLETAVEYIPKTNPLLKDLFQEYCQAHQSLGYDEFELYDIISVLKHTDIASITSDFNRQTGFGKEDPIVYFYEKFLDAYEHEEKKRMGVYYTPVPTVNFIVRSISHLLEDEFHCHESFLDNRVSILDPAAGTGTFLRSILLESYTTYKKLHGTTGWGDYLKNDLLSRIFGLEAMMAPYAIAHMKLALTLRDTGFTPSGHERLHVYLTNTLDGPLQSDRSSCDSLAKEAAGVAHVRKRRINVILGNPPYRCESKNQGKWIMDLMNDYKKEPRTGTRLVERNAKVINDDYVKFIRFAQDKISGEDKAIISYVLSHGFIDNLTFRGMRWSLLNAFTDIYILNLHGSALNGEKSRIKIERDENIFDIQQGICICFLVRNRERGNGLAKVHYSEIFGTREYKYHFLGKKAFKTLNWVDINPAPPYYFFKNKKLIDEECYQRGIPVTKLFPIHCGGVKTHADKNLVSTTPFHTANNHRYAYRPYDTRYIDYDVNQVKRPRYEVMKHFIGHENLGLIIDRQVVADSWSHVHIVSHIVDNRFHYSNKGIPIVCPMFLYDNNGQRRPNIDSNQLAIFSANLTEGKPDITDLFDYCYGILHSKTYRERYQGWLSIEFPKVPIPSSTEMFKEISAVGAKLRQLHLIAIPIENRLNIQFSGIGNNIISNISHKNNCCYINKEQYFTGITKEIFDFPVGGYHGLQKWFKDRKGLPLSTADIKHVINVFNILKATDDLMKELDNLLEERKFI